MNVHIPPIRPGQTYSQGFWYAVIAASLYMIGSMMLMINLLGYFRGHYRHHFDLDDDQRTLILQTMVFSCWLAGGAAVFAHVCSWSYADALYFSDVTVLTVGFGDFVAPNNVGRGLVFPYAVFGIIFLGLMINSVWKFALGISEDNIIKAHQVRIRKQAVSHTVSNENELRERLGLPRPRSSLTRVPHLPLPSSWATRMVSLEQYGHFTVRGRTITFYDNRSRGPLARLGKHRQDAQNPVARHARRRERLILLKEEKDRFDEMREIQANTRRFKQYWALSISVVSFALLWCVGAVVFMCAERREQNMSYFEALYFCYVSLLTIGYGDFSPRSNAGKPFFVIWSLVAVPTMTLLVSDMSQTVVSAVKHGTFTLADWTVLPKNGVVHDFLQKHPWLTAWRERMKNEREARQRITEGFTVQDPDKITSTGEPIADVRQQPGSSPARLEQRAEESPTEHDLARKLALAIKRTVIDLRLPCGKKYSYEEWVEFMRLIHFSVESPRQVETEEEEEEEELLEWDWIGENSPMLANISESEWILDRLCESLNRYTRRQARRVGFLLFVFFITS